MAPLVYWWFGFLEVGHARPRRDEDAGSEDEWVVLLFLWHGGRRRTAGLIAWQLEHRSYGSLRGS